jgi:dipeptidyl aminopeptidase/acylaminoacyl peptidase
MISPDWVVRSSVTVGQIALDGGDIYWVEGRPEEGGRNVIVRCSATGGSVDITPAPFNARSRVHEYGGGAYAVFQGSVYFSNDGDSRVYRQSPGESPIPISEVDHCRYADFTVDSLHRRLICVREDHRPTEQEAINTLVAVPWDGGSTEVLVSGSDFYCAPRLSGDGKWLAWLSWMHPNMPWDGCELWCARIAEDGSLAEPAQIAGGVEESIFQPEWSPDGELHFVSDRSGWWNLYRWSKDKAEPLCPMAAEFGRAYWVFGLSTYGFAAPGRIICAYTQNGAWRLGAIERGSAAVRPFEMPFTEISYLKVSPGAALFCAGSPYTTESIVRLDLESERCEPVRDASSLALEERAVSSPEPIEFPAADGKVAYAFYYSPANPDYIGAAGEHPPLLVLSHGGPTSAATTSLNLAIQYWTSRGFAVVDVNYGGSTGYGRAYRMRLNGQWGIVDVDDCVSAARSLVARNFADPARLIIRGRSAGGYTTLAALTFRDAFKAGASYYGVSDLTALVRETHKFESRYCDRLIASFALHGEIYRERSPIHHVEQLHSPVIFLQGLEDKVVPPDQAERMVAALRAKRIPVAYLAFAGEQHGFRKAENIKRSLEAELYFYSRVFGFELAESVTPIAIEHLPA